MSWDEGDCAIANGRKFSCRGYPYTKWCTNTDPSSMYGRNAWTLTDDENISCRTWSAGQAWGWGDCALDANGCRNYCQDYTNAVYCITVDPTDAMMSNLAWENKDCTSGPDVPDVVPNNKIPNNAASNASAAAAVVANNT